MAEEQKLFGMPAKQGRWLLIVLGFIINICLGSVYAYSIFGKQLTEGVGYRYHHVEWYFPAADPVRRLPVVLRR